MWTLFLLTLLLRCLADSNRRRRFCRPLTKPLIQGTLLLSECKGNTIFLNNQIFFCFFCLIRILCSLDMDFRGQKADGKCAKQYIPRIKQGL